MADLKLERLIDIQELILKLRSIERITYNPKAGYENDVEHSYGLAFMAWLMAPRIAPGLNFYKLQTYSLVHDLVEVYAGDTFCFADEHQLDLQPSREKEALERLTVEFNDFPELADALKGYFGLADEEARFIFALDKLQPIILNYLDGGRVWRENRISYDQMFSNKLGKSAIHPSVHRYVVEMARWLQDQPELFSSTEETNGLRQRLTYA